MTDPTPQPTAGALDAPAVARRIAELDVAITIANATIDDAKAERATLETTLLDYIATAGVDQFRVTVTGPDGAPMRRVVSPRTDTWAFPEDKARALRALRRHYPDLVNPTWNAQTISAVFREADRAIEAGNTDPIPAAVRKAFYIDRRPSIRTTKAPK